MDIKPRVESWPFIWGAGNAAEVQTIAIQPDVRYLFPEYELPYAAPDLQDLVNKGVDYSVDPKHLGSVDVALTGRQFMNEIYERHIEPEELGAWSPRTADDKAAY